MAIVLPTPKDRNVLFNKQVTQESIGELSKQIIEINHDDKYISELNKLHGYTYTPKPIKLYIDSYGGAVYQCFGLLGLIEKSKTPIHTIVTGCAMSCGFLMSISGHKRFAYNKSTLLYHQISGVEYGKMKDIEEGIIEMRHLQKLVEQHTINHTKISREKLKQVYKEKIDWFITAKEALKLGVIDEII